LAALHNSSAVLLAAMPHDSPSSCIAVYWHMPDFFCFSRQPFLNVQTGTDTLCWLSSDEIWQLPAARQFNLPLLVLLPILASMHMAAGGRISF
jgi:hypothetical protein